MHLLLVLDGECDVNMYLEFLPPDLPTTRHYAFELGATINLFSIKLLWSENFATAHKKFWTVQSSVLFYFLPFTEKYISFILVSFVVVCSSGCDGGVSVCVYVWMWRSVFDVQCLPQVFYTYFLRQGFLNTELFKKARLLNRPASKSRGSSHVCLSITGITDVCHHVTPVFMLLMWLWFCSTQDINAHTTTEPFFQLQHSRPGIQTYEFLCMQIFL